MLSFFQKLLTAPPQTREELKPSPETLALVTQKYQRLRPVGGLFLRRWGTFTASGLEHIPREGPVIILTNHVAHFDALHINYMVRRPVIFLASTALFSGDMRSRFLQSMGMIPKRKFTPDARAIRTLRGWIDSGAAVGIFPEGERSWDGEPLPMVPGIAKLIRFLDAPVVTGRIHNGDHHWPRWSPHHRRTRVHLELDEAVTFGRRTPPDDITRYISQRIVIPPDQHRRWPARGSRQLCEGLSNLLFCCPACQTPEALTEQGAQLSCSACAAAWRLDTSGVLTGIRGGAADTTIAEQRARLQTAVAAGWVPDPERLEREGIVLESGPCILLDQSGTEPVEVARGRLRLTREALTLHRDGETLVELPLSQLRASSIEERRRLWLMTADRIYEPDMPEDSIVKWGWVVEHARQQHVHRHGMAGAQSTSSTASTT